MRTIFTAAAAAAAALAVVGSGSALGAYTPRLAVTTGTGSVTVEMRGTPQDDPTAHLVVYVPKGYGTTLTAPVGTKVGTGAATAVANGLQLPVPATVTVADASQVDPDNACAPGPHEAVWTLALKPPIGSPLATQVYVDRADDVPDAVLKLQTCLPSPADKTLNPLGAQVTGISLTLNGILRSPVNGTAIWRGLFTPYTPGTTTVNALGTVEADANVRLPARVTLKARAATTPGSAVARVAVAGNVTDAAAPVAAAKVSVLRGATPKAFRTAASATTSRTGSFGAALPARLAPRPQALYVAALVTAPPVETGTKGCDADSPFADQDIQCVSSTTAGFALQTPPVRVTLPKVPAKKPPRPAKR